MQRKTGEELLHEPRWIHLTGFLHDTTSNPSDLHLAYGFQRAEKLQEREWPPVVVAIGVLKESV